MRYGLIEQAGPTGVVTPKMSKGIGWKVKLTCDPSLCRRSQIAHLSGDVAGEIGRVRLKGQEHSVQAAEKLPRK